jgi:uncharacterized protein (DUF1778 family)
MAKPTAKRKTATRSTKRTSTVRALAKGARLEARVTAEQKALLTKAAALTGRSVTDFVVSSAHEAAIRAIRERAVITLAARDQEAFARVLTKPSAPGPRLRAAAKRYRNKKAS